MNVTSRQLHRRLRTSRRCDSRDQGEQKVMKLPGSVKQVNPTSLNSTNQSQTRQRPRIETWQVRKKKGSEQSLPGRCDSRSVRRRDIPPDTRCRRMRGPKHSSTRQQHGVTRQQHGATRQQHGVIRGRIRIHSSLTPVENTSHQITGTNWTS